MDPEDIILNEIYLTIITSSFVSSMTILLNEYKVPACFLLKNYFKSMMCVWCIWQIPDSGNIWVTRTVYCLIMVVNRNDTGYVKGERTFLVPTFLGPIKDFIIKIKYIKPDDQWFSTFFFLVTSNDLISSGLNCAVSVGFVSGRHGSFE